MYRTLPSGTENMSELLGLSQKKKYFYLLKFKKGHAVVQLVEALPEVRGFDSRLGHWEFLLT
jgi:hypothetical protein